MRRRRQRRWLRKERAFDNWRLISRLFIYSFNEAKNQSKSQKHFFESWFNEAPSLFFEVDLLCLISPN